MIGRPACRFAMAIGANGQVAVAELQATAVQESPGAAGSASTALSAADGPKLDTTMV